MALASPSSTMSTMDCTTLKCRKCRFLLVEQPPHKILDTTESAENLESSNVFNICDENLPQWINDAVEEGNWTKGKLSCPSCGSRIGGFDYVTRSSLPVYIVRSKVDLRVPGTGDALANLTQPKPRRDASAGNSETTNTSGSSKLGSDIGSQDTSSGDSDIISGSSDESNTESDHAEASRESSTDEEIVLRSKKQKEKMRKKRRHKEMMFKERLRAKIVKKENERKEAKLKELLEGEPELSELGDDSICPVCLDLLHEPFQVEPCGHIFCEPCLRRLGQKNPMNCTCPLCRTKIGFCKHLAATAREIREEHEGLYLKRKKFERSTPVFSYPLPWQPGWRNLIRGRPLGGNRFLVRDNRAEYMRAILHQIPYYIPPVMIANLINIGIFAFMMGFIEVFPNLLALVFGSGKNMSLPLNATEISETSGDLLPTDADAERSLPGEDGSDDLAIASHLEDLASPVLDTTFYYVLFALSVLAAALGQFLLNHELHGPLRFNRVTDMLFVIVLTVLPLMLIPTLLPFRSADGTWFGNFIEKGIHFLFNHLNYHTAILLCFTVWFIYHVDVNEDVLW